jgi:hypothetical protein
VTVTRIRCGSCKDGHPTVAEVRACYGMSNASARQLGVEIKHQSWFDVVGVNPNGTERKVTTEEGPEAWPWATLSEDAKPVSNQHVFGAAFDDDGVERGLWGAQLDDKSVRPTNGDARPMSEKQRNFIVNLNGSREIPVAGRSDEEAAHLARLEDVLGGVKFVSLKEASALISYLNPLPRKSAESAPKLSGPESEVDVPVGRYALEGDDGVLRFYQVDRPTEGRWRGYLFINGLQGAPGDYARIKLGPSIRAAVLKQIAADPKEASLRYGREVGVCGVCHSPLTNAVSREAGIGPVCRAKREW